MENSSRYFKNHSCEYFPCHTLPPDGEFNCLFCYCPLYSLGDKCGGVFEYTYGIKTCMDCIFPHIAENYDEIIEKLKEMNLRGNDVDS